ncbi:hypothetical protein N781_01635 [Pontibacillus halophilus JSM 076056 = DSM 19796]|uniref:SH3b domain-containing protein n=2 Tax=Pontibacillus TaxID=289201 RepID=A0A0A5IE31_9BACI|nr:SH3 domain-containing protein [Pontibacillus halophilus]KGX94087.1 hypothetical protein N781_01635 [Pontibacillus halophilus JSM 076056 = DSM 19796]
MDAHKKLKGGKRVIGSHKKRVAVFLVMILVVAQMVYSPYTVFGEESGQEKETMVEVELQQTTSVFRTHDDVELVELTSGAVVKGDLNQQTERISFSFLGEDAYVKLTSEMEKVLKETTLLNIPDISSDETIDLKQSTSIFLDEMKSKEVGSLHEDVAVTKYQRINESTILVYLADLTYYISHNQSQQTTKQQTTEAAEEQQPNQLEKSEEHMSRQPDSELNVDDEQGQQETEVQPLKEESVKEPEANESEASQSAPASARAFTTQSIAPASTDYYEVVGSVATVYTQPSTSSVKIGRVNEGQKLKKLGTNNGFIQVEFAGQEGFVQQSSLVNSNSSSVPNWVSSGFSTIKSGTSTSTLSVYDNSGGTLKHFATIEKGQTIQYDLYSGSWYEVNVASRKGFVYAPAVKESFTAESNYFKVLKEGITVRQEPSSTSLPLGSLYANELFKLVNIEPSSDWMKIEIGGDIGYIPTASVEVAQSGSVKNWSNNTGDKVAHSKLKLTIYDNSSGSLVPFASLPKGKEFTYIREMGAWLEVMVAGRKGYVYKPAVVEPFTSTTNYVEVIADTTNVYPSKSFSNQVSGKLFKGETFKVLNVNKSEGWAEIQFQNRTGYVLLNDLIPSSKEAAANWSNETKQSFGGEAISNLTVYDNSSGKLVHFASISKGEEFRYVSRSGAWLKVLIGGREGFVYAPAVKENIRSTDTHFEVFNEKAPVYISQSDKATQMGTLYEGEVFKIESTSEDLGWVKIRFEGSYGYVRTDQLIPSGKSGADNWSEQLHHALKGEALSNLTVYDNSTGSLLPFASISASQEFSYVREVGSWLKVMIGGRTGYVYSPAVKKAFTSSDKYVEALEPKAQVFSNSTMDGSIMGHLEDGQSYIIHELKGNAVGIKFGNVIGYVSEDSTRPLDSINIQNRSNSSDEDISNIITTMNVTVYDNTSGSLVPFGQIAPNQVYPVIGKIGSSWYKIQFGGRDGYIYSGGVESTTTEIETQYDQTFNEMLEYTMGATPQYDMTYYNAYVHGSAFNGGQSTFIEKGQLHGIVVGSNWNVRGGPSTDYWKLNHYAPSLEGGEKVKILRSVTNDSGDTWYQIDFRKTWKKNSSGSYSAFYRPFVNANKEDVAYYLNPENFMDNDGKYQFLSLSQSAGISANEVNQKILDGAGTLEGTASAFIEAAQTYSVNEIYLIAHAIHETGSGTATLMNGNATYNGRTVYNAYGIGAYDSCALECGSRKAYEEGWFTPEAAIIGGAKFIGETYIHNSTFKQDTLYEMKWNPTSYSLYKGYHHYATDIGWASKQARGYLADYYKILDVTTEIYEIPNYGGN